MAVVKFGEPTFLALDIKKIVSIRDTTNARTMRMVTVEMATGTRHELSRVTVDDVLEQIGRAENESLS